MAATELLYRSGLATAIGRRHAGVGAVFVFHRVASDDSALPALHGDMYVKIRFLETWLAALANEGVEVVSMDEAVRRVANSGGDGRFVVLTFDDGYVDTVGLALPVLERFAAPFTVFVTTNATNGRGELWWLGLERLVRDHDALELAPMDSAFDTSTLPRKSDAIRQISAWVWADVERRGRSLRSVFERYGVSARAATRAAGLSPEQLRALARHPLATIGGHTTSHPWLPSLAEAEVAREMAENRDFLGDLCQRPIRHFAYPYGAGGPRMAAIAKDVGFETAVTNTPGCLFPAHRDGLLLLPRHPCTGARMSLAFLHAQRCGVRQFLQQPLRCAATAR